ncbi:zinc finger protein 541-like [Stigmatopora argus]
MTAIHTTVGWINIGSDFQAVIPPLNSARSEDDPDGGEQFLWKSWEEPDSFRDQVEPLLRMCCSSCVPGGGCNPELALHSLHACQSDVQAALRMLLFESTSPTGDYHYSGSDVWTPREKNDFDEALCQLGKNFALIQEKVKSKTLSQCVEFYYLSTKHQAKRMKGVRREDSDVTPRQNRATSGYLPTGEEAVPGPPPAVSFPCLECGKVFSKVKSRNAHMKVHRKLPKAWNGRAPPQRAAPYSAASLARPGFLSANDASAPSYSYTCANGPNFQVGTMLDFSGSLQRMAPPAPVFNPSWRAFV